MIRFPQSAGPRVCVLAGGQSSERAVSLASGHGVARALAELGYRVEAIDPVLPGELAAGDWLRHGGGTLDSRFEPQPLDDIDGSRCDVVFLALHGGAGEDGRVQQFLQDRQIPFTGPGSASARLAMSKGASKQVLRAARIATPDDAPFDAETPIDLLAAQAAAIGFPVVVKPDAQGSSLGVGLAHDLVDLVACRDEVLRLDRRGLVEPLIEGREFTLSIVGRQPLPVVEVLAAGSLFSYADKYSDGPAHCRAVDDLPPATLAAVRRAALATADVLDTRGLVRVDLRLDETGEPWVLELNAIPGLTPASLAPFAAHLAGWSFAQLCDRLVRDAVADCRPGAETIAGVATM